MVAEPAHQQRQHVVAPARVDAGDEQRPAALGDGGQHRVAQLGRGVARVVQRVDRGGDDHGAGADRPDDVGERVVGPDVARRRVHDGAGPGAEDGVDVVGGGDAEPAVEAAEVARVAADLVGVVHDHGREVERRMGGDGTDGGAADVPGAPDDGGDHRRRLASVVEYEPRPRLGGCRAPARVEAGSSRSAADFGMWGYDPVRSDDRVGVDAMGDEAGAQIGLDEALRMRELVKESDSIELKLTVPETGLPVGCRGAGRRSARGSDPAGVLLRHARPGAQPGRRGGSRLAACRAASTTRWSSCGRSCPTSSPPSSARRRTWSSRSTPCRAATCARRR